MITIELKDLITAVLAFWANTIATISLIRSIRKDKKKTAPKRKPKHMRKR